MSVVAEKNLAQNEISEGKEEDEDERLVGTIIPPPELRHIIETTATFVAKNGQSFEERIIKDNPDKKKFDFLLEESPYNQYYRNKIKEIILKLENPDGPVQELNSEIKAMTSAGDGKNKLSSDANAETPAVAPELIKTVDNEFLVDPPTLKSEDIMTLKLTAQYAAVNGRSFLIELSEREFKNQTFDFLKPQHSHFAYFTKLIEQYVKILTPDDSTLTDIHKDNERKSNVLKKVQSRVSWMHFNAKQKANIKESDERDRIAYSQIDWNEFTIVETIDYKEGEEGVFLPPCQPNQIGMRNLMQERMLLEAANEEKVKVLKEEANKPRIEPTHNEIPDVPPNLSEGQIGPGLEEMKIPQRENSIGQPRINSEKVIEANYDPKSKTAQNTASSQSLISPFTGENISATNVQQHMKYILESKKDRNATGGDTRDSVYASGDEIARNLKKLHDERLDIFQVGVDEGKKKFIPPQFTQTTNTDSLNFQDNMPMYGQLPPNMNAAPIPMPPLPEPPQIPPPPNQFMPHKEPMPAPPITHNTNLPPSNFAPVQPVQVPFVASFDNQFVMPGFISSQPNMKKFKSDKNVLPEVEFLNQYGNDPLPFFVVVPNLQNNNNWDLQGQTLQIAFPLDQPLSKLKNEISRLTNFPVSKQKLQFDNTFLKDHETLALHNVNPKSYINILVKERGGKKK